MKAAKLGELHFTVKHCTEEGGQQLNDFFALLLVIGDSCLMLLPSLPPLLLQNP